MRKLFILSCVTGMLAYTAYSQVNEKAKPEKFRTPTVLSELLRGPYLQVATSNSIIIRWRTSTFCRSVVNYGLSPDSLNQTVEDPTLTLEHKVQLTGLIPQTRYYYSIGGGKEDTLQKGPENFFVTLPLPGTEKKYRILALGDCGNNSPNQRNVRDQVVKYLGDSLLDAWILLGDNAYSGGTDPEYQEKFFNIYKNTFLKKYPLFPAPGNHEYNDLYQYKATAQATHDIAYYQNFTMPTKGECGGVPSHSQAFYSFDIGNIHFLSLDSYGKEDQEYRLYDTLGPQTQWVKKDLEAYNNSNKKGWIIAFWHHPPYTMGSHNSDKEADLIKIRENFIRILERYGVDLILCGHSHLYERSKLMKGHYGAQHSYDSVVHALSNSSGLYDGSINSCPYVKNQGDQGTVYVVSGSAGALGRKQEDFPHKAMYYSNNDIGGASMIEVEGNRLELKWICADGEIRDHFVMMKNVNKKQQITAKKGQPVTLTASYIGDYRWNRSKETGRSIQVKPPVGTTIYEVYDPLNCIKDTFEVKVFR